MKYGNKAVISKIERPGIHTIYALYSLNPAHDSNKKASTHVFSGKCYCAACQKIVSYDENSNEYKSMQRLGASNMKHDRQIYIDAKCPDCGNDAAFMIVRQNSINNISSDIDAREHKSIVDGVNISHAYEIPEEYDSRDLSEYKSDEGKTLRLDDDIHVNNAIITSDFEPITYESKYSLVNDFVDNRQYVSRTCFKDNKRSETMVHEMFDPATSFTERTADLHRLSSDSYYHFDFGYHNLETYNGLNYTGTIDYYNQVNHTLGRNVLFSKAVFRPLNSISCGTYKIAGIFEDIEQPITSYSDLYLKSHDKAYVSVNSNTIDLDNMNGLLLNPQTYTPDYACQKIYRDIAMSKRQQMSTCERTRSDTIMKGLESVFTEDGIDAKPKYFDIYSNPSINGLYFTEHGVHASEATSQTDVGAKLGYELLYTCYPALVEYSMKVTDAQCENWLYAEKRKAAANPEYKAREEIPASVVSRFYRFNMTQSLMQLRYADDKIRYEIHKSNSLSDMYKRLSFFVFGKENGIVDDLHENPVPKHIELLSDDTMQSSIPAIKSFKKSFNANPMLTANNVYSCHKLGIHSIDDVNKMCRLADGLPKMQYAVSKRKSKFDIYSSHASYTMAGCAFAPFGMIVSPKTDSEMSFMSSYHKDHPTFSSYRTCFASDSIWNKIDAKQKVFTNADVNSINNTMREVYEDLRLYKSIYVGFSSKTLQIAVGQDDISDKLAHCYRTQLHNYLINISTKPTYNEKISDASAIQKAYVDYIDTFGENTQESVDKYVNYLQKDVVLNAMKDTYDASGIDGVRSNPKYANMLSHFPPYCDFDLNAKANYEQDKDAYINTFFTNYKKPDYQDNETFIFTRNQQPLFHNRSIKALHEELSQLAIKYNESKTNKPIEYTASDKKLETKYDSPSGHGDLSFNLHKDTYEMIRTAQELSNCLASHIPAALDKSTVYLFMRDSNDCKVGCISLNPVRNSDFAYELDEIQDKHDVALKAEYKEPVTKWCQEHNIKYVGNSNYVAIGTGKSFYGLNADYHHQEIDEATGTVLSVNEHHQQEQTRQERAAALYSTKPDGSLDLPDVPVQLTEFQAPDTEMNE